MKTAVSRDALPDDANALSVAAVDLCVFLAYENLSVALQAADLLDALKRKVSADVALHLSPWSFATLEAPEWRSRAMANVRRAHLIIIAASGSVRWFSPAMENWLKTCLRQSRENRPAVAAFLVRDDRLDFAETPRLRAVQRHAQEAGCAFIAPGMAEDIGRLV